MTWILNLYRCSCTCGQVTSELEGTRILLQLLWQLFSKVPVALLCLRINFMAFALPTLEQIGGRCLSFSRRFFANSQPVRRMELRQVVSCLNSIAPLSLAESWDNVGLLVEPSSPQPSVELILLTNDLTEAVMDEALSKRANLIYCYHPVIFSPLKRITTKVAKDRVLIKALENRVAIYCPHTALDAVDGGVNDWLASGLGAGTVMPLSQVTLVEKAVGMIVETRHKAHTLEADLRELPGVTVRGIASKTWIKDEQNAHKFVVEVCCGSAAIAQVVDIASGYCRLDDVTISEVAKAPQARTGCGRIVSLHEPVALGELVSRVKKHLGLQNVRLAVGSGKGQEQIVQQVAVCAGSGGKLLSGVQADVYLSGEMSHHEVLSAVGSGHSVILCEHSNTERGFLHTLQRRLSSLLAEVAVEVSAVDSDPLQVV